MKYWTDIELVLPESAGDLLEHYMSPDKNYCPIYNNSWDCASFSSENCTYQKDGICVEQGKWEETTEENFFHFFFYGIETGQYLDYDDEKSVKDNFFDYVSCDEENEIFERYLVWRRKQDIEKRNKEDWYENKKGARANSSALLQC